MDFAGPVKALALCVCELRKGEAALWLCPQAAPGLQSSAHGSCMSQAATKAVVQGRH